MARRSSNTFWPLLSCQLTAAQKQLDEIKRVLEALGDKLDAAKLDEVVDVDSEVDQVEELIWLYNDAIEAARDAWLRDNLSGNANTRLLQMLSPASLELPAFTDDEQFNRAKNQIARIGERLHARDARLDRIVWGAKAIENVGTAAGIAAGGGILFTAAKTGGRWAVVKTVAIAVGVIGADYSAEKGLRAAGAGDQTIRGIRLAVAVVSLILLRRRSRSPTSNSPPVLQAKPVKPSPAKSRLDRGRSFNKERAHAYPYNEVPIEKPGRGQFRLDSYDPIKGEVVFRRRTQFSEIQFKTAKRYLLEFVRKYPPGSVIADVPSAKGLAGEELKGKLIFEVPPQWKAIPQAVLREAARLKITIRDTNGREY